MRGGKSRWYTRRKLMAGYGIHLAIANKYFMVLALTLVFYYDTIDLNLKEGSKVICTSVLD